MDAQDALDREFAAAVSELVEMIWPTATHEDKLKAKGKFAALCNNTMLQTVQHMSAQAHSWGGEGSVK